MKLVCHFCICNFFSLQDVVGKVLLGGKALTSLNQGQITNSLQIQSTSNSSNLPSSQSQTVTNQASVLPSGSSAPTRVVTVQKVPSAVVQGATSSVSDHFKFANWIFVQYL